MIALTTVVAIVYMIAFVYVVGSSTAKVTKAVSEAEYPIILFLEKTIEVLSSISNSPYAYFFAVVMNFVLLYGIFIVNMCSVYLMEISKTLEQRRTGGRRKNEVEMGQIASVPPSSS